MSQRARHVPDHPRGSRDSLDFAGRDRPRRVHQEAGKATDFPYAAKSPIVVCVNGYERARERLTKLATAALPTEAPKLTKRLDEALEKAT